MIDSFHQTFEFKGVTLQPFSEGRRALILSIMGEDDYPKIIRLHAAMFAMICEKHVLKSAFCRMGVFIENAMEWAEKNIDQNDYEQEGQIISDLMNHSSKSKVEVVEDASYLPDPSGN